MRPLCIFLSRIACVLAGLVHIRCCLGAVQEQRKLRKQRREEREKEKQDLIRQGLLEPPPPKVPPADGSLIIVPHLYLSPTPSPARGSALRLHDSQHACRGKVSFDEA